MARSLAGRYQAMQALEEGPVMDARIRYGLATQAQSQEQEQPQGSAYGGLARQLGGVVGGGLVDVLKTALTRKPSTGTFAAPSSGAWKTGFSLGAAGKSILG